MTRAVLIYDWILEPEITIGKGEARGFQSMKLKPLGYGLTCYLFFSFSCHQYFCSTLDVMFFTGHDLGLYSLFVFM